MESLEPGGVEKQIVEFVVHGMWVVAAVACSAELEKARLVLGAAGVAEWRSAVEPETWLHAPVVDPYSFSRPPVVVY